MTKCLPVAIDQWHRSELQTPLDSAAPDNSCRTDSLTSTSSSCSLHPEEETLQALGLTRFRHLPKSDSSTSCVQVCIPPHAMTGQCHCGLITHWVDCVRFRVGRRRALRRSRCFKHYAHLTSAHPTHLGGKGTRTVSLTSSPTRWCLHAAESLQPVQHV